MELTHHDRIGFETLELFAHAGPFNSWMFETVAPWCRGTVLETGSGIGNISAALLKKGWPVVLSDLNPTYCDLLKKRFRENPNLRGVFQLDLTGDHAFNIPPVDTIISLNVLEHIENERGALCNCNSLLKPGGRLILLVPALRGLYNSLDIGLGHYRRYNRKDLNALLESEGFTVVHTHYFNAAGLLGWWVAGSLQKKQQITNGQFAVYNTLLPLFRLIDIFMKPMAGLSVIAVAEKKDPNA